MGKKIGKLFVLMSLLSAQLYADPSVTMSVFSDQGKKTSTVRVGVPFLVQVTVSDEQSNLPTPHIEGLDQFLVQGTSSSTSTMIINGQQTVSQQYQIQVVAEREGTYSLGPVSITVNGVVQNFGAMQLEVSADAGTTQTAGDETFLQLSLDKESAYIGEPLQFSLRFYYTDPDIRNAQVQEPQFKDFTVSTLDGPHNGTEELNGKSYRYLEWKATVYPARSGELSILPSKAQYSVPDRTNRFGFFIGGFDKVKHIYSNNLKVQVKPVPSHTPPVQAVGTFRSFTARLNNQQAGEGEGIVLTLEVVGRGNIEQIKHPSLELPDNLTVYESNSSVVADGAEHKKSFEYIVQGLVSGTYTIPEQTFVFFNPTQETFGLLQTEPVELVVKAVAQQTTVDTSEPTVTEHRKLPELSIIEVGAWKDPHYRKVPTWFFILSLLGPLFVLLGTFLWNKRQAYLLQHAPELRYNNAFKQARIAFDKARAGHYDGQLYHIFIELFSARLKLPKNQVSENLIEATLRKASLDDDAIIKWRLMFAQMAEQAFSSYGRTERNDGLFNQAAHWLSQLEKIL